jgi:hypothetical protein
MVYALSLFFCPREALDRTPIWCLGTLVPILKIRLRHADKAAEEERVIPAIRRLSS